MLRHIWTAIVAAVIVFATLTGFATTSSASDSTAPTSQRRDADCSDFSNQRDAQNYYINHGGPQSDPDGLDSDDDGVACESNPCPCSTSQGGGGNGGGGGSTPPPNEPTRPPLVVQRGNVIRVIDGDTIEVRLNRGGKANVRILGIDTPEVYGGRECGGPAASQAAKKMLPRGTSVVLRSDRSQDLKDRYGRLLRYVQKGATDIGKAQLRLGNAEVYVYRHHPFNRVKDYKATQAKANRQDVGIWGNCR